MITTSDLNDSHLLWPAINLVGAFAAFVLWGFPSIFLHELGHITAARLLGLTPTHLIVGEADEFLQFRFLGIHVIFRMLPFGGLAIVKHPITHRLKAFLFIAAGPASNALIIWCCLLLWPGSPIKWILAVIISTEILNIAVNLVPIDRHYEHHTVPSDGKRLFQILFGRFP